MTLLEAITLAVSHHPNPSRQLKWYYKHKIIFAGMRGEILTVTDKYDESRFEYDTDSFMKWLKSKPISVYLDDDIKLALDGKGKEEVSKLVNNAVRSKLRLQLIK